MGQSQLQLSQEETLEARIKGTKELEEKVTSAERKYQSIIKFVEEFAQKFGENTKYSQQNSYTTSRHELKGFEGFDNLIYHGSYSDTVQIVYKGETVLSLLYGGSSDTPTVEAYKPGEWESKLDAMIKNEKSLMDNYIKKQEKDAKRTENLKEAYDKLRERERLVGEKAKKLGLLPKDEKKRW
ncbi:MAG TPA: hypothetical protein VJ110_01275 [Candidatus Nanoarchaeia archaeon]|nr:hypothetical protein [Candidatus Nanoarchaeia archaeon]